MSSSKLFFVLLLFVGIVAAVCPQSWADESNLKSLTERINRMRKSSGSDQLPKQASAAESNPVYRKMLRGLALVQINSDDGTMQGTGWVLDRGQRLLVTNHHVIEGFTDCYVYFPQYVSGKLNTDPETSLTGERAMFGRVVDSDQTCDLALIQLDEELPKGVVALELADKSAAPGSNIHSIAGSAVGTQSLWTYSTGHVRQVVRGTLANGYEATLLESDIPTNQGNSGGPVCNDEGKVVAVVEGQSTQARLVSMDVDLQSVVDYLADALRCVNPKSVEDLQFSAQRHLDESRSGVAAKLVTKALKQQPDSAELLALRGWCWYWSDDEDSALADFEDALKENRRLADGHFGVGCVHYDRGDYGDAISALTNAIRNDPEEVQYRVIRGDAYWNHDDLESAKEDYEYVLRGHSEMSNVRRALAMVEIDLGNYQVGIEGLDRVVEDYDEDPQLYYYSGWAQSQLRNYDDAVKLFAAALHFDEDYPEAHSALGETLCELGRPADALVHTTKAISLYDQPNAYLNHYHGRALYENGHHAEGLKFMKRATEQSPNSDYFRDQYQEFASQPASQASPSANESAAQNVTFSDRLVTQREIVGNWYANIQEGGNSVDMHVEFLRNGRFKALTIVLEDGERVTSRSEGAYQVNADSSMILWPDDEPGKRMNRELRWAGKRLGMTDDQIDFWILFDRTSKG
ncbi:MAG: tetratricopeptide repeat protein [Planctomycetota bacterium]